MGLLIKGEWHDKWYDTAKTGGRFVREDAIFRHKITGDGSSDFQPEPGRYHLYVSYACPWAHRTLIFRKLKKLEDAITISVVDPFMGSEGWMFSDGEDCIPDTVNNAQRLHQIYTTAKADYTGRVTVPILWDKQKKTIVNNESSEIILMMNSEFPFADNSVDYYPEDIREEIEEVNTFVYKNINNGVYKAGFATSQQAYEEAYDNLFKTLDELEERLGKNRYLLGDRMTVADWRLFTTLVRFDAVYVGHFKCNLRRIADYPNLSGYTRELYQVPGVAETTNMTHIKRHYYESHKTINPTGVVPKGPQLDLDKPHNRG
ncbi:glutathione S-transferase family protein [Candidatus Uabimicrobium amorphum]|uniref:Glutathione-dependent reductase n=1 Tax=Uabimicrobium amorphum TaxID=2596890 RepID=A0A5S9ISZ4_UABAM|nr:glutathione S-transferase family protein [Candidatus Uabimicrobium amorphum]BBM87539.1 glutathione-dependent reductase [Candidatus Uabimicrobium amorphum]